MDILHELFESVLNQFPKRALEKLLAVRMKEAGVSVDKETLSRAAEHILSRGNETFKFGGNGDDVTIHITNEDIEYVNEQLASVVAKAGDDTANLLFKFLCQNWPEEFTAHQADVEGFKKRLEDRWGKPLGKLRMLLAIVMEWAQGFYERRRRVSGGRLSHLDDVMLRLHVRACQVTGEIIVLLENGYADGAMARWRTLHEITIAAGVIAKFGEELAERYVYYQIVESFSALKAYERNHKDLGFKPPTKTQSQKVGKEYAKVIQRFGNKFGEENGWAAHHLKVGERQRVTFARLEEEAGDAMMRSPYKMASYNVHASPKGVYFKLGSLEGSPVLLAGASNAGLTDPAQHTAVSLAEITLLIIGDSPIFDDIVIGKIVARLEAEILPELGKADRKLRRDDRRHRGTASKP
jgi:Family of unknown function (DUF5677)